MPVFSCLSRLTANHYLRLLYRRLGLVFALAACSLQAYGDDIDDIRATANFWAENIGEGNADVMVGLYAEDAILPSTSSPVLRKGKTLFREYFAPTRPGVLEMFFLEPMNIRVFGGIAVNTGNYGTRVGDNEPIPLRYSLIYRKSGDPWLIIDHHSSLMPDKNLLTPLQTTLFPSG